MGIHWVGLSDCQQDGDDVYSDCQPYHVRLFDWSLDGDNLGYYLSRRRALLNRRARKIFEQGTKSRFLEWYDFIQKVDKWLQRVGSLGLSIEMSPIYQATYLIDWWDVLTYFSHEFDSIVAERLRDYPDDLDILGKICEQIKQYGLADKHDEYVQHTTEERKRLFDQAPSSPVWLFKVFAVEHHGYDIELTPIQRAMREITSQIRQGCGNFRPETWSDMLEYYLLHFKGEKTMNRRVHTFSKWAYIRSITEGGDFEDLRRIGGWYAVLLRLYSTSASEFVWVPDVCRALADVRQRWDEEVDKLPDDCREQFRREMNNFFAFYHGRGRDLAEARAERESRARRAPIRQQSW